MGDTSWKVLGAVFGLLDDNEDISGFISDIIEMNDWAIESVCNCFNFLDS